MCVCTIHARRVRRVVGASGCQETKGFRLKRFFQVDEDGSTLVHWSAEKPGSGVQKRKREDNNNYGSGGGGGVLKEAPRVWAESEVRIYAGSRGKFRSKEGRTRSEK